MKQLYIHIGLHKTGSTYIQKVFADNRSVLRELGIDYPQLGAEFLWGHHNLAWSLMPAHPLKNTEDFSLDQFLAYLNESKAQRFVISSEDFEFLQSKQVSRLRDLLANYDVKIVMYVRNPMNALYSRWQESVKHGDTTSIKDYCEQLYIHPKPLDYAQVADIWANVFGQEAMNIIIYENLVVNKTDIALYFLNEILEVSADSEPSESAELSELSKLSKLLKLPAGRVNPSSDMGVIEVLRQLNQLQHSLGHQEKLTDAFMRFVRSHPQGQELSQYLQTLYAEESHEFVDLLPLNEVFVEMSQKLFRIYKNQIKNICANDVVFEKQDTENNLKILLIDSELISKKVDIEALHRLFV
jgi:hypothetical protein